MEFLLSIKGLGRFAYLIREDARLERKCRKDYLKPAAVLKSLKLIEQASITKLFRFQKRN